MNQKRVRNRIHNGSRSGAKSVPQPAPKLTQKRCEKRPETCTRNSPRRGNKWHQNAAENESKTRARIAPNPGPKMVPKLIPKRRQNAVITSPGGGILEEPAGPPNGRPKGIRPHPEQCQAPESDETTEKAPRKAQPPPRRTRCCALAQARFFLMRFFVRRCPQEASRQGVRGVRRCGVPIECGGRNW